MSDKMSEARKVLDSEVYDHNNATVSEVEREAVMKQLREQQSRPVTAGREESEQLARDLAVAFHGDEVEWRGFLSKAQLILGLHPTASTRACGVKTIPLPLWAAEDLLKWMRKTNDHKPALYPLGLENLLQALVSTLSPQDGLVEALEPFADFADQADAMEKVAASVGSVAFEGPFKHLVDLCRNARAALALPRADRAGGAS